MTGLLINILISLLIIGIVIYGVSLIMSMIEIDPRLKQLVWLIIAVVVIVAILSLLSGVGGGLRLGT